MPRTDVGLVRVLNDGLVVLRWMGHTSSDTDAIWSRGKLRKPVKCAVTEIEMAVGDLAYRPVGNQDYRSRRISVVLVDELKRIAVQ